MKLGMALMTKKLKRGSSRVGELKLRDELVQRGMDKNKNDAQFFKLDRTEKAFQPAPSDASDAEVLKRIRANMKRDDGNETDAEAMSRIEAEMKMNDARRNRRKKK